MNEPDNDLEVMGGGDGVAVDILENINFLVSMKAQILMKYRNNCHFH